MLKRSFCNGSVPRVIFSFLILGILLAPDAKAGDKLPDAADPYLLLRGPSTVSPVHDWLTPSEPTAVQPYPANGTLVKQTPPVFRWPHDDNIETWEINLRLADGSELQRMVMDNWLFLEQKLPPGGHSWRVRGWKLDGAATEWSSLRKFTVPRNAHEFLVPDFEALFERASNKSHPRHLPQGELGRRLFTAIRTGSRQQDFRRFRNNVEWQFLNQPLNSEPDLSEISEDDVESRLRFRILSANSVYREAGAARFAAYAWIVTKEARYLREAMRRVRNLAAWDPRGGTGLEANDSISREIAFTLATVLDLTLAQWTVVEREWIDQAITVRVEDLFEHFVADEGENLARMPYNSHGFRHAGAIAAISSLLAGRVPQARQWFLGTLPVYIAMNSPWGGDDGGFANGLNYAGWNLMAQIRQGDILEHATGLAVRDLARMREVGQYLRFFAPPGTPDSVFGDGHERDVRRLWRQLANVYARRLPTPYYRQYARRWGAATATPDNIFAPLLPPLEAQWRLPVVPTPMAAHFPSIGWTAMHSDLDDPDRTSVYFLSSPYGSFNHSHAAQNSFVIHARGRRLAISSGYYDFYNSAHHQSWTRQSKSKNAITFDGGIGQHSDAMSAIGRTLKFHHGDNLDFVVGDAALAYGRDVQTASRTLAYLRPNTILVYDLLEAVQPKHWEWNIHALNEFTQNGENAVVISNGPVTLCVEMVAGPAMDFAADDQFPVPPDEQLGQFAAQWHGTFTTREKVSKAEILAVLSVDCAKAPLTRISNGQGGGYELVIGWRKIAIDASGVIQREP